MALTPEQEAFLASFADANLAEQQVAQAAEAQKVKDAEMHAAIAAERQALIDQAQADLAAFDAAVAATGQVSIVLTR